jgi:sporulation protein YlmC with PRC-barrel domain
LKTYSELRGMQVASLAEGALIGKMDDFLFELDTRRILGYRLRNVMVRSGGLPAGELKMVGEDLVFASRSGAVDWVGIQRVADEGRAWASLYRGAKVMSRRGSTLGEVEDLGIDPETASLVVLVLDRNRRIVLDDNVSLGRDAVVVDDASRVVAGPEDETEVTDWRVRIRGVFRGGDRE